VGEIDLFEIVGGREDILLDFLDLVDRQQIDVEEGALELRTSHE